ncbi:cutinase family protein [Leucobacter sp. HNU]|uniref:cutinase family protein n=1 Tax=Leucobacter sp. HNU TaxID=3236805 RepID=UPI003A803E71
MRDRAMDPTKHGGGPRRPVRRRRAALAAALGLAVLLPPVLSACASEPDANATRSSLSKVTEPAAPPKAAEKFDAKKHPDPIAQPEYCTAYLVITARGTGEPVGNQLVTPVARRIAEARPGEMLTVNLIYPADTDINEGGTEGVRRLIDQLNVQAEHCPDQRTILLGYSQGAFVIGDALVGPKDRLIGETVGELTPEAKDRLLAVVLYGDPASRAVNPTMSAPSTRRSAGSSPVVPARSRRSRSASGTTASRTTSSARPAIPSTRRATWPTTGMACRPTEPPSSSGCSVRANVAEPDRAVSRGPTGVPAGPRATRAR